MLDRGAAVRLFLQAVARDGYDLHPVHQRPRDPGQRVGRSDKQHLQRADKIYRRKSVREKKRERMCVCMREREGVFVCVYERKRGSVCVCVMCLCVYEKQRLSVYVRERKRVCVDERERDRVCVWVYERESGRERLCV